MRIGMLTPSVSRRAGGMFDAVRWLAGSLQSPPVMQVFVFGLEDEDTVADRTKWGNVPVTATGTRGPRSWGYAAQLAPAVAEADLDLLHVHGLWMYPSVVSRNWARSTSRPCVIAPHGMLDRWAVRNSHWKKRIAGALYESGHLRRAACLHALCEAEAQAIRAYGLRNPICIIPNGIRLHDREPSRDPNWRNEIPEGAKILLYVGRLHPKKGLPNLLHAWDLLHRRGVPDAQDWHLAIAGWNEIGHGAELRALSETLSAKDKVHFLGPQFGADKQALFQSATAFVIPSFSEGLPMVVLEAWAYGLPVLMTPQCNLPEGFRSAAALRIEASRDSIAQGLEALFSMSDDQRRAIGKNGRQLVEERFSYSRIAADMGAVYRWLSTGGPQPDCVRMD